MNINSLGFSSMKMFINVVIGLVLEETMQCIFSIRKVD